MKRLIFAFITLFVVSGISFAQDKPITHDDPKPGGSIGGNNGGKRGGKRGGKSGGNSGGTTINQLGDITRLREEEERINQEYQKSKLQKEQPIQTFEPNGFESGHEYVSLGLSVKWATCNLGTSSPSGYGNYYAWGETTTKSEYIDSNCLTYGRSKAELQSAGIVNSAGNLTPAYDAARANWGGRWRMPTKAEMEELVEKCTWTWTSQGGTQGYKVTGPSGNSIFLPAAGWRFNTSVKDAGDFGIYWTSTCYHDNISAYYLYFDIDYQNVGWCHRDYGRSIRPVTE